MPRGRPPKYTEEERKEKQNEHARNYYLKNKEKWNAESYERKKAKKAAKMKELYESTLTYEQIRALYKQKRQERQEQIELEESQESQESD